MRATMRRRCPVSKPGTASRHGWTLRPSRHSTPSSGAEIGSAGATTMRGPALGRNHGPRTVARKFQYSGIVQGRSFKGGDLRIKLQKMRDEQSVISWAKFVDRLKTAVSMADLDFEPTVCQRLLLNVDHVYSHSPCTRYCFTPAKGSLCNKLDHARQASIFGTRH